MPGFLYPAYQKYYSALQNLKRFDNMLPKMLHSRR